MLIYRGARAAELRIKKGLGRPSFAQLVGSTRETIRNAEEGFTQPRPELVKAIADALGVDIDELYEETAA